MVEEEVEPVDEIFVIPAGEEIVPIDPPDALDEDELAEKKAALEAAAGPVMTMSGVAQMGVTDVLRALRAQISEDRIRRKQEEDTGEDEPWQP